MTMPISAKKRRRFLQILAEIQSSVDDETVRVSLSKLRDINAITIQELKRDLRFSLDAGIIRIADVRLFDSGEFLALRKITTREARGKLGVSYVPDSDDQIRRERITHFLSSHHTWDMRDKLDIEINPDILERELHGARIGEVRKLSFVDPVSGIMQIVVNGNCLESIRCRYNVGAWKDMYNMAQGKTVPYNKQRADYINRPNNIIFSQSRLPHKPLVNKEGGRLHRLIPIERLSVAEFRRRRTKQTK